MISLGSWRRGGMLWKDSDCSGRMGREDEEGVLPFIGQGGWSAWISAWGWVRSQARAYR